jgi:hypothetical protein
MYYDLLTRFMGINEEDGKFHKYSCRSIACMVNNDFPRYLDVRTYNGKIIEQEYATGSFYAKVFPDQTKIYRLMSCMLVDEVKIEQPLWLNSINFENTLDKVQGLHYILLT